MFLKYNYIIKLLFGQVDWGFQRGQWEWGTQFPLTFNQSWVPDSHGGHLENPNPKGSDQQPGLEGIDPTFVDICGSWIIFL